MHITIPYNPPCVCPTCNRCPACGHYVPQVYGWPYTTGTGTGFTVPQTTGTTVPDNNFTLTTEDSAAREWSVRVGTKVEDK